MMGTAAGEIEDLRAKLATEEAAARAGESAAAEARSTAERLEGQLEEAQHATRLAQREAADKGDRLAQMEGGRCVRVRACVRACASWRG